MGDPNVARRLTTWHGGWCGRSAKWLRKRVREEDTAGERERERDVLRREKSLIK